MVSVDVCKHSKRRGYTKPVWILHSTHGRASIVFPEERWLLSLVIFACFRLESSLHTMIAQEAATSHGFIIHTPNRIKGSSNSSIEVSGAHQTNKTSKPSVWFCMCLLSASQHHDWVFLLLMEMQQKLRTQTVYDGCKILPEIFGSMLYSCVYIHCQQLMQSVRQPVMAAHHRYLCWRWWVRYFVSSPHKVMTAHCHAPFKLLLWRFLCTSYNQRRQRQTQ